MAAYVYITLTGFLRAQVSNFNTGEVFCMSTIVGGGPTHTIILGASFHRAYYVVYVYDATTNAAEVRCRALHLLSLMLASTQEASGSTAGMQMVHACYRGQGVSRPCVPYVRMPACRCTVL